MEKTKVLLGIVVAVILVFGVASPATAANMVLNGDLETDLHTNGTTDGTPDGMPDNWTFVNTAGGGNHNATGTWDTSTSKSPTHSYRMSALGSGWYGRGSFTSDKFVVTPKTTYTLTCQRKVDKTGGSAHIAVRFFKADGTYLTQDTAPSESSTTWALTTKSFYCGDTVGLVEIQFVAYDIIKTGGYAGYWMDDVSVTPEPATMTLLLLGLPFALRRRR